MAYSHIPTFVNKGAFVSGTAGITVAVPSGYRNNDLLLLICESANQAITAPTGWTETGAQASQSTGTAAAAGGVRLAVFWKIASGAETSVAVADSGDHNTGIMMAFRGVDPASPINVTASNFGTASTSMTWPAVTTTVANTLIVLATAVDTDAASTTTVGTVTAAGLGSITERHDQTAIDGAGGGVHVATGTKATAGATGTMTATASTSVTHGYLTIALQGRSDGLVIPRAQYKADQSTVVGVGGSIYPYTDGVWLQSDVSPVFELDQTYTLKTEAQTTATSFSSAVSASITPPRADTADVTYSARGGSLEYDTLNDVYLYFGGYDGTTRYNNIWVKDMKLPGQPWRKQTTSGTAPTAVNLGASAYYVSNGVGNLVIWGGNAGSDSNQMLILNTTTFAWRTVTQTSAPTARSYITKHMVAVPNGANADIYLFGGWATSRENQLVKMASLSNTSTSGTWTTLKATGTAGNPSARSGAIMSYKASSGELWIYGGYNGTTYLSDLWKYSISGNTFTQVSPTGTAPTGTELGAGGYDATNNRFWYSGGWSDGTQAHGLNNIGYVSGIGGGSEAYVEVRANDTDNQMYAGHSSSANAIDTKRGWLVIHGLMTVDSTERYTYAIDLNDGVTSNKPVYGMVEADWMTARDAPASVWNPDTSEWLLINGFAGMGDETTIASGTHVNDIWAYDSANNRWRFAVKGHLGMPHTEGSLAVYDTTLDRIVVFGGLSGTSQTSNEVWSATTDANGMYTWARLHPTGTPPTSRWLTSGVYDATNNRLLVVQGGKIGGPTNEVWELSFSSSADGVWTQRTPSGSITGVTGPGFAVKASNTRLYIFGGATNQALTTVSSQLAYLDYSTTSGAYTTPTSTSGVAVRTPSFGYDPTGDRLIVEGGFNGTNSVTTTQFFLLSGTAWAASAPTVIPDARRSAGAMWISDRFYISHGRSDSAMWYKNTWSIVPNYTTPSSSTWANLFPRMFTPEYVQFDPNVAANYHWQSWITEEAVDHTKVSYPAPVVSTYYFNASLSGPSDPNSIWTNDANAFDGNTATFASIPTGANAGSTSSKYLGGGGTTAPSSGSAAITQVRVRYWALSGGDTTSVNVATASQAENLGTTTAALGTGAYGSYLTLTAPAAGWSWSNVNALEVRMFKTSNTSNSSPGISRVEIEVTSGNSDTVTAATDFTLSAGTPPTVVLNTPTNAGTTTDTTPDLLFTGTDTDGDTIEYEIQLDTVSTFDSTTGSLTTDSITNPLTTSWTAPSGVTSIAIEAWGAGGSADNLASGNVNGGAGGGAGAYAKKNTFTVTGGTPYTIQVGAGGLGTTVGAPTNGAAGGDSWFNSSATVKAAGGGGGGVGAGFGGTTLNSVGDTTFAGGSGAGTFRGGAGGGAGSSGAGNAGSGSTGGAAKTVGGGKGGNATATGNGVGVAGSASGGGGGGTGGTSSITAGANGAAGRLDMTYTPQIPLIDKFSATDTGFSAGHPFTSGTQVTYTVQSALTSGVTYYWRVRAIDPTGTNTYGAWSSTFSFTVSTGPATFTRTHTTDALKRTANTRSHTTDSLKRASTTKTHTTDSNKRKATTVSHSTDSLKKKAGILKTHTTDANKRVSGLTRTHTTDANKKLSGTTRTHTTDSLKRKQFTKTHTTDSNLKKTNTRTHTTDANKKLSGNTKFHTTDSNKRVSGLTRSHSTDAFKRKQFTVSHTTNSNLKKSGVTKTHTTDANKRVSGFTKTHTTDALKRQQFTKFHTTDSNRKKATTVFHTTDSNKRTSGLTRTHTTDALKRKQFTLTHTTDSNKKKSGFTVSHTTSSNLKKSGITRTHTTDSFLRKQFTKSHTTDSNRRKAFTLSHTTSSNKRKALTVSHSTDANKKLAAITRTHTTDALKRKQFTLSHTTDSYTRSGTFSRSHTTDSLKRKANTVSHTTDSLKRKSNTLTHTTDSNKKKAITISHTTDANKKKPGILRTHTTDSLKRTANTHTHTTDSLKRTANTRSHTTSSALRKQFTKTHTTDSLLRKASTKTHTTDANRRKALTVTHTTDANKKTSGLTRSHTTDSNKRKSGILRTHTTDSLLRKAFTRSHTTDSLKRKASTLTHTTDSNKRLTTTKSHTTDSSLDSGKRYWVGGTATWDGTAGTKWAAVSGGAGGFSVPTGANQVFFDGNSGSGTVTIQTTPALGGSFNATGFTGTLVQNTNMNIGSSTAGDFIFGSGMTFTWVAGAIKLTSTKVSDTSVDLASQTVGNFTFNGVGANFVMASDITASGALAYSGGSVDMNGYNAVADHLSNGNTTTRNTNLRGGTITLTGTGNVFDTPAGTLTFTYTSGAKIIVSDTSATAKTFNGGTLALPSIEILGAPSDGTVTFTGAFSTQTLKFNPDANIKFTSGVTTTATALDWTGTSGHTITIQSTTPGTPATISVASGIVSADYLLLKDNTATGGATFYAGNHSTDNGGNTGWFFSAPPATYTTTHTTDSYLRRGGTVVHSTDALKRKANTRTHTTDSNKRKAFTVAHSTDANKRKSGLLRTHTTDSLLRKQFTRTHTTDSLKRTANVRTHTTDALKRRTLVLTHTTDSLKRKANTRTHTTDALLRKAFLKTHTTDSNKRKATLVSHSTDANKKKSGILLTHTTDALKRKANAVSHTTDALKKTRNTKSHTTDSFIRKSNIRTHTTDSLLRKQNTRTHTTDSNKRKATLVSHTTDSNKKKSGLTVFHKTDANKRISGFTKTHTTDSFLRKAFTKSHSTDANRRKATTVSHNTDAFIRTGSQLFHNTDANKKKAGITRFHTTDANKRTSGLLKTHTTDSLKRKQNSLSHTTDANKKKAANTRTHTTDSLLRRRLTLSHSTDSLKRTTNVRSHTTDSLIRKANTRSHTTDANKRKATTVFHTTSANKRLATIKTHTTDANKRKAFTVFHTTSANKRVAGILKTHTTDSLKRKANTKTHTTDSLKRKANTLAHTTDALKRTANTRSHTTDANKRKSGLTKFHTTDSAIRRGGSVFHTTDANKKKTGLTVFHTTSANKRKALTVQHFTDANKRKALTLSHTTDSNKRRANTVAHSTDSLLRKANLRTHTTDSFLRKGRTIFHTSDALKRKGFSVSHSTDAYKKGRGFRSHTTDANLRSDTGKKHVLIGGVWVAKPVFVLIGGVWVEKRVRWFTGTEWKLTS